MKPSLKSSLAKPLTSGQSAIMEIIIICTVVPLFLFAAVALLP